MSILKGGLLISNPVTPIPLDNYYQCYETYDDDITVITSNTVASSRSRTNEFGERINTRNILKLARVGYGTGVTPQPSLKSPQFDHQRSHQQMKKHLRLSYIHVQMQLKRQLLARKMSNFPTAANCFNTGKIKIAVNMAVADAGATGHFVLPGTPVIDMLPTPSSVSINLPTAL